MGKENSSNSFRYLEQGFGLSPLCLPTPSEAEQFTCCGACAVEKLDSSPYTGLLPDTADFSDGSIWRQDGQP